MAVNSEENVNKNSIDTNDNMTIQEIPLEDIFEDEELNCRGSIAPFDVIELKNSIERNGLLQPITVQPYKKEKEDHQYNSDGQSNDGEKQYYKYRIVVGYRRFNAFKVLGKETIPCIIKNNLNEIQTRILNLQENLERQNLNVLQEAQAIKKFKDAGYTLNEVAKMVNMSTGWCQIRYALLDLEPEIQTAAAAGYITQTQIKDLYSMRTKEERYSAVKQIKDSKLRGEKKSIQIKKPRKNPTAKKLRNKQEIFDMQEHIIDTIGGNFGTRCLAWASGEISDMDLYRDLRDMCKVKGIPYSLPRVDEALVS